MEFSKFIVGYKKKTSVWGHIRAYEKEIQHLFGSFAKFYSMFRSVFKNENHSTAKNAERLDFLIASSLRQKLMKYYALS